MARSDEAQAFFHAVYSAAQQIPYGKVTTYAHLAYLVGTRMFYLMEIFQSFISMAL
jgi:O6-methylguanine-DNA--protein-cysteine methyltransferase